MEIAEIIKLVVDAGLAFALAGSVIYWYRSDSKERIADEKQRSVEERSDKLLLVSALQDNTHALTELSTILRKGGS